MTRQELNAHIHRRATVYAFGTAPIPAIEEAPQEDVRSSVVNGPDSWWEAREGATDASHETYCSLSSSDMDIRTIRSRIDRFLDDDDYTLTKQGNRIIFNVKADMIGWINRRLY